MWSVLRLLTTSLCAHVSVAQVSYRVIRVEDQDGLHRGLPEAAEHGVAQLQAPTAFNTGGLDVAGHSPLLPSTARDLMGDDEKKCLVDVIIIVIKYLLNRFLRRRLAEGDFAVPTQIRTSITITDPVDGETVYPLVVEVGTNGEGTVELESTPAQLNEAGTGLCEGCTLSILAGECISGDCGNYDMDATNDANMDTQASVCGDPHMVGLLGQKMDWAGVDGEWYCLISDGEDLQLNVRVTAPMPEDFPDRQLVTGISLLLPNGHSLVVEVKDPYTIETDGCVAGPSTPCLADGALRVLVDDEEAPELQIPGENIALPEGVRVSATNLPAECRPFGGDIIWAAQFEKMTAGRRSLRAGSSTPLDQWVLEPDTLAAPTWCAKFLEHGPSQLLATQSNHATLRIETPAIDLRVNIGINHQELVVADDGSTVVPELEFWQTDLGLEWHSFSDTVGGLLGDTSRFVFDNAGNPIRKGIDALHGPVENYRVPDAFGVGFEQLKK